MNTRRMMFGAVLLVLSLVLGSPLTVTGQEVSEQFRIYRTSKVSEAERERDLKVFQLLLREYTTTFSDDQWVPKPALIDYVLNYKDDPDVALGAPMTGSQGRIHGFAFIGEQPNRKINFRTYLFFSNENEADAGSLAEPNHDVGFGINSIVFDRASVPAAAAAIAFDKSFYERSIVTNNPAPMTPNEDFAAEWLGEKQKTLRGAIEEKGRMMFLIAGLNGIAFIDREGYPERYQRCFLGENPDSNEGGEFGTKACAKFIWDYTMSTAVLIERASHIPSLMVCPHEVSCEHDALIPLLPETMQGFLTDTNAKLMEGKKKKKGLANFVRYQLEFKFKTHPLYRAYAALWSSM